MNIAFWRASAAVEPDPEVAVAVALMMEASALKMKIAARLFSECKRREGAANEMDMAQGAAQSQADTLA